MAGPTRKAKVFALRFSLKSIGSREGPQFFLASGAQKRPEGWVIVKTK